VLLIWALITCFLRLGAAPVYIDDEAREGIYARAMLATGNFVLPEVPNHVENDEIISDRPPLVHWLSAAATVVRALATEGRLPSRPALVARYDEWSLRFPSALAGVVTIAAIALLGRRLVGDRAALLAAAALLASLQFIQEARFGRIDMALCGGVTVAMLFAGHALLDGAPRALLLAAVASAFAVLAKGPLGIVLPLIACTTFVLARSVGGRSTERWWHLPWGRAALLWALLALSWYVAAIVQGGMAVVRSQMLSENLAQSVGQGKFAGASEHFSTFYYAGPWLLDSAPWSVLGVLGAWRAWRRRDPRAGFCVVWWLCFLAVFQFSAFKRRSYLLPAVPAGALLAGYWMDGWLTDRRASAGAAIAAALPRWWPRALGACLVAAAVGGLAVRTDPVQRWLGADLAPIDGALACAGIALGFVAIVALGRALWRREPASAVVALWFALVVFFLGPVTVGGVVVAQRDSPVPLVRRVMAELAPDQSLTVIGLGDDPSMLVLFYFPDSTRIVIVPKRAGIPASFAPGHYLIERSVWETLLSSDGGVAPNAGNGPAWRMLWSDVLPKREERAPLVFAERRQ
jgi:4-amino-4-deoxy-L-arabinose transferase-like glycosyltransferase